LGRLLGDKAVKCLLAFSLLFLMMVSAASVESVDREVEAIIVLNDEPASVLAARYGLPMDSDIIKKVESEKLNEVTSVLDCLSKKAPLTVEEVFTKAVVGALVKTYSRFIQPLSFSEEVGLMEPDKVYHFDLKNSVKMVEADKVWSMRDNVGRNVTGVGVKVAVLDTGVNYSLPALGGGFGPGHKVAGGYDFVDNDPDPMDLDGHGTAVAAIIAGKDDNILGVAPDAMILAYRVITSEGQTTTSKIIRALEKAAGEGASVVNLSFGGSGLQASLGIAIRNLVDSNIVVVAAAGNSGPKAESIEFPSSLNYAICVGASSNLGAGNLKAEFEVAELGRSFEALPLNGTVSTGMPLQGELVYVGLGGGEDVAGLDLRGKIALAKRGKYYFSDKAKNVYDKGAVALIVFNNVSENFVGMLKDRVPIPVASISGEDGERIVEELKHRRLTGKISISEDDYQPAWFTSRGPVSPFYVKPNLLAPGDFVVSANFRGGYTNVSGTSFAAPHVSGAVALIRQAMPNLRPREIMYLLMDSALPLSTGRGLYSVNVQGGGLMQVYNALKSDFIMDPGYLVFHLSPSNQTEFERSVRVYSLSGEELNLTVSRAWNIPDNFNITVERIRMVNRSVFELTLKAKLEKNDLGLYFCWLNVSSSRCVQHLPVAVYVNPVGVAVEAGENLTRILIFSPSEIVSGKAVVYYPSGEIKTIEYRAGADITFASKADGEYWIAISIAAKDGELRGYYILSLGNSTREPTPLAATAENSVMGQAISYATLNIIFVTLSAIAASIILYALIKRFRSSGELGKVI